MGNIFILIGYLLFTNEFSQSIHNIIRFVLWLCYKKLDSLFSLDNDIEVYDYWIWSKVLHQCKKLWERGFLEKLTINTLPYSSSIIESLLVKDSLFNLSNLTIFCIDTLVKLLTFFHSNWNWDICKLHHRHFNIVVALIHTFPLSYPSKWHKWYTNIED